jgi:FtsH-binding integral membrane protein
MKFFWSWLGLGLWVAGVTLAVFPHLPSVPQIHATFATNFAGWAMAIVGFLICLAARRRYKN